MLVLLCLLDIDRLALKLQGRAEAHREGGWRLLTLTSVTVDAGQGNFAGLDSLLEKLLCIFLFL